MSHIFSNQIRVIQNNFSSINFTNNLYDQVDESLYVIIKEFIEKHVPQSSIEFIADADWLGSGYRILYIGNKIYRIGAFLQNSTSCLVVELDTFSREIRSDNRETVYRKVAFPGFLDCIEVYICPELAMDAEELAEQITQCFLSIGKSASVDFRTAFMDYTLYSGADRIYDVLRKSKLDALMNVISLYVVYENLGRHIPSSNRLGEIVNLMNESIYKNVICPFQLASNFFLHPLSGKQSDLFTQVAFRQEKTLIAERNKYSGGRSELASKTATEAFFGNIPVAVQPIVKSGDDKMLISAIYPAHLCPFVEPELIKLTAEFHKHVEETQKTKRLALGKLAELSKLPIPGDDYMLKFITYLGGFTKGFFTE